MHVWLGQEGQTEDIHMVKRRDEHTWGEMEVIGNISENRGVPNDFFWGV